MVCRMNGQLWYAILNENDRKRNLNVNRNDLNDIWNANYRAAAVSYSLLCSPRLSLGDFLTQLFLPAAEHFPDLDKRR